jgi:hypothetical protein
LGGVDLERFIRKLKRFYKQLKCKHNYYVDYIYITSSGVAETVLRCDNCKRIKIREATKQDFIDAENIY